jgi:serine/threonine-protein kinase
MKSCPACEQTYSDDLEFCPRDGSRLVGRATETQILLAAGLERHFRIIRRLGAGGMGAVFLAEQLTVGNRLVALKVLNRKLLDVPGFLLRFQSEAGSTGRIRHANVVTIYESGQGDDGTPYIAMEFLEGESLREALQRRGAPPLAEVTEIITQAARGLNAAHKRGIIHRDVKPDNIFLTQGDEGEMVVKVVDFGIAKLLESSSSGTSTGIILGTPAYMSSEQASGMRSDQLDARSDIYSLGVVTYEMLAGRVPFYSDTPMGYLRQHLLEQPPPFRAIAKGLGVPSEVESVVMRALVKDREYRYASALDFSNELNLAVRASHPAVGPGGVKHTEVFPVPPVVKQPLHTTIDYSLLKHKHHGAYSPGASSAAPGADVPVQHPSSHPRDRNFEGPDTHQEERMLAEEVAPADLFPKVNSKEGIKYVWIPPGRFRMGCSPGDHEFRDDEKPPHQVTITKGFWLGQTTVTVGAYRRFAEATGRDLPPAPSFNPGWSIQQMPMVHVSWRDALAYCAWAGGRLPTEAEWEYAARGTSAEARHGPIDEVAWYNRNSRWQTHPVGGNRPNRFGLYDMLGNVWEWVMDWYDEDYYKNSPAQDPAGPANGEFRALRGGSWGGEARFIRVSSRNGVLPGDWGHGIGFRCARDVSP